ncbi:MAG: hypothetical protein WC966_01055 [Bradymonadales bacterium]
MLIAFNNDIEFRSRWYHIQTEDNGVKDGHITTTVFFSGQILESKSISYLGNIKDVAAVDDQNAIIKELMVTQHRQFYQKLYEGSYEEQVNNIVNRNSRSSLLSDSRLGSKSMPSVPPLPTHSSTSLRVNKPVQVVAKANNSVGRPPSAPNAQSRASAAPLSAPVISAAVQKYRSQAAHLSYAGFRWSNEDLAIDVLAAEFLEANPPAL